MEVETSKGEIKIVYAREREIFRHYFFKVEDGVVREVKFTSVDEVEVTVTNFDLRAIIEAIKKNGWKLTKDNGETL